MKALWVIFFIVGFLAIVSNIPLYIMGITEPDNIPNVTGKILFYIGINIGFILGIIFFTIGSLIRRKWIFKKKKTEQKNLVDGIGVC